MKLINYINNLSLLLSIFNYLKNNLDEKLEVIRWVKKPIAKAIESGDKVKHNSQKVQKLVKKNNSRVDEIKEIESSIKKNIIVDDKRDFSISRAPTIEKEISVVIEKDLTDYQIEKSLARNLAVQNYRSLTKKQEIINEKFIELINIFSTHGLKGCKNFNKYHEIIQILEMQHMVDNSIVKGELPSDLTLHWVSLAYDKAPDLFIHWISSNGNENFRTIQLKSLNTLTNKKFIYKLNKDYSENETDMIFISIKDIYMKQLLSRSKYLDLESIERIHIISLNDSTIDIHHNYIIAVIMKNFAMNQLYYNDIISQFYKFKNEVSYRESNNIMWNSIDIDIKSQKDFIIVVDDSLINSSKNNLNTNSKDLTELNTDKKTIQLSKNKAAKDLKENFVRVENPENKLGSHWYTSISRAKKYEELGIKLTPSSILIGQSTGFDKF